MAPPRTILLGHRGGRGAGWPAENTLDAFQRALDEGADGVELDVRLCRSGEAVVVHDRTLAQPTNGADPRGVHEVGRADLPRLAGGARIADLGEALDLCHGHIVNVEVKADGPRRTALALVRAVSGALARARPVEIVISSFDPLLLLAFAVSSPRCPRALLIGPRTKHVATVAPLALRRSIRAAHLEDTLASAVRVDRLRRAGLRVVAWTVNDEARAVTLARLGVDWIITDQPASILAALSLERAQRPRR